VCVCVCVRERERESVCAAFDYVTIWSVCTRLRCVCVRVFVCVCDDVMCVCVRVCGFRRNTRTPT